jgi:hypothetical protein
MLAVPGVTAIEESVLVAAFTVSAAVPFTPVSEAVTLAEPAATPLTMPPEVMVATDALDTVQLTVDVTFAVVPLL